MEHHILLHKEPNVMEIIIIMIVIRPHSCQGLLGITETSERQLYLTQDSRVGTEGRVERPGQKGNTKGEKVMGDGGKSEI